MSKYLLYAAIAVLVIGVILIIISLILDFVGYRQLNDGLDSGPRSLTAAGIMKIIGSIFLLVGAGMMLFYKGKTESVKGKLKGVLNKIS